jgi:hypothetical protein
MESRLPTGIVALLMTDVVASTDIWRDRAQASAVLHRQAAIFRRRRCTRCRRRKPIVAR